MKKEIFFSGFFHLLFFGILIHSFFQNKKITICHPKVFQWIDLRNSNPIVFDSMTPKTKDTSENAFLGKADHFVKKQTLSNFLAASEEFSWSGQKNSWENLFQPEGNLAVHQAPFYQNQMSFDALPKIRKQGIEKGNQTLLSTKEFKYFTYFQRMRNQLIWVWGEKLRKILMSTFLNTQGYTMIVLLRLNSSGDMTQIQLLQSSGIELLDKSAISIFHDLGSFPNPPQELIHPEHGLEISWTFFLKF